MPDTVVTAAGMYREVVKWALGKMAAGDLPKMVAKHHVHSDRSVSVYSIPHSTTV